MGLLEEEFVVMQLFFSFSGLGHEDWAGFGTGVRGIESRGGRVLQQSLSGHILVSRFPRMV